jgi:hypothetical protein
MELGLLESDRPRLWSLSLIRYGKKSLLFVLYKRLYDRVATAVHSSSVPISTACDSEHHDISGHSFKRESGADYTLANGNTHEHHDISGHSFKRESPTAGCKFDLNPHVPKITLSLASLC